MAATLGDECEVTRLAYGIAEKIVSLQPDGPIRLAGFSLGAVLAYEVAWCLQRYGRPCAKLVLLDPVYVQCPGWLPMVWGPFWNAVKPDEEGNTGFQMANMPTSSGRTNTREVSHALPALMKALVRHAHGLKPPPGKEQLEADTLVIRSEEPLDQGLFEFKSTSTTRKVMADAAAWLVKNLSSLLPWGVKAKTWIPHWREITSPGGHFTFLVDQHLADASISHVRKFVLPGEGPSAPFAPVDGRAAKTATALLLTSGGAQGEALQAALLAQGGERAWVVVSLGEEPLAHSEGGGAVTFSLQRGELQHEVDAMLCHAAWASLPPLTGIVSLWGSADTEALLAAMQSLLPSPPPPLRLVPVSRTGGDDTVSGPLVGGGMPGLSAQAVSLPGAGGDAAKEAAEVLAMLEAE
mmetsp:Transcript_21647/g.71635  ORF Transcript_21647/g.71635 Transcript_21647/m.71635 type:complete len:408 (+) Transcript_21647:635-1858(+)